MRFWCGGLFGVGGLFLLLFDGGEAEEAELLSEPEIFAVGICRKVSAVQVELAVFIDQALVHVDGNDIGDEHIV